MTPNLWLSLFLICCCLRVSAQEAEVATEVTVSTGKIIKTTLHRYVMAYGSVEAEAASHDKPAASSKLASPMMGILQQVYCAEGQQVEKGAVLFELDSRSADALIAKADMVVAFAKKNFARKQQLNATDNISHKLYEEAEQLLQTANRDLQNARIQRELLKIRAPLSGTVTAIHYKVGEAISINTVLAEVLDLQRLEIVMHIPSTEALDLAPGQPVLVSLGSGSTLPLYGKVSYVGAQIDPLTDTVLLRATIHAGNGLRAGQRIQAQIEVEARPGRLAVPVASVINRDQTHMIAVVDGDIAKLQTVNTGLRDGNLLEINGDNLQEGMTVVTQGVYGLPHDSRIKVAP